MVRLGDIGRILTGNTPKTRDEKNYISQDINFVKPSDFDEDKITDISTSDYFISELARNEARILPVGSVLVTCIGIIGKVGINSIECAFNQQINAIIPDTKKCNNKFLAYEIQFKKDELQELANAPVVPILNKTQFSNIQIKLPAIEEQNKIVANLDKVNEIIDKRKQQIKKLDELVKSRFIEMFGDPVKNPYGFKKVALSELADIKIGPFGSLLHKEDYVSGGHPILNPSHIVNGKIIPDNHLTISDEKYNELEAYHLNIGDVIMGRRGEMGRCAVITSKGFLCGTGSLLIRSKGEITADYLQKTISFPSFKKTIEDLAVGQTMPNLNVPIVSRFQIIKPPIDVQNNYYTFVEQADKSKLEIQKSLDKLEILKKSLMQQYFG